MRVEISLQRSSPPKQENRLSFEFYLPSSVPDSFTLSFRNYYASTIILMQEGSDSSSSLRNLREPMRLMNNPYNEAEAEQQHFIDSSTFSFWCNPSKPVRVVLQTSPLWRKCDIKDLKMIFSKEQIAPMVEDGENMSLSSMMLWDASLLSSATQTQSILKSVPDIVFPTISDTNKRPSKRKEKKERSKNSVPTIIAAESSSAK